MHFLSLLCFIYCVNICLKIKLFSSICRFFFTFKFKSQSVSQYGKFGLDVSVISCNGNISQTFKYQVYQDSDSDSDSKIYIDIQFKSNIKTYRDIQIFSDIKIGRDIKSYSDNKVRMTSKVRTT